MKVRIGILPVVALCVVMVPRPHTVEAQTPPNFFTMIFVPDIHHYDINGNPGNGGPTWDNSVRPWITARFHDSTWNAVSVHGLGDMVSDPLTGPTVGWTNMAADWQSFADLGYPITVVAGNHDSNGGGHTYWDSYIAPTLLTIGLTNVFDGDFPNQFGPDYICKNCNQYRRIDVPTAIGMVKLGVSAANIAPNLTALGQLRDIMNADTDRQQIYTTHMFVSETVGFHGAHPCINGEGDCALFGSNSNYAQSMDGAGQWAVMKDVTKMIAIFNGHSHNDGQWGKHSAQMTGTAGNVVEAFSDANIGTQGPVMLATFWVTNTSSPCGALPSCIAIRSWNVAVGTAGVGSVDTNYLPASGNSSGGGVTMPIILPWTPLLGSNAPGHRKSGNTMQSGRIQ